MSNVISYNYIMARTVNTHSYKFDDQPTDHNTYNDLFDS